MYPAQGGHRVLRQRRRCGISAVAVRQGFEVPMFTQPLLQNRSLQNLRRYSNYFKFNVEVCLNLWVCSCLLVHGDVSKENVLDMEAIELAQRVAWLHHVTTRVAPVAVISQGHGGKCGFVHGTHRFLEFEPLRATWRQFGSVRTSWNHLGVLLAAIWHHVSIVSDVFSMLSFHPATPRLDKARCLVCTQKFTSSTHVWHLPRAQEPRRGGLPERFMWWWRDRVQSQMGSVFWLGSDGVEEHPFPQNIQIFLGLAASRLHLHRLRPCISAAVTTMASSLIQTLAVICHNHALWCGLQVTIRGKSRVIVSGHWSIYLCNFWSLYFWFTRNLCLWRHFKHILQVRCHFQSLFRNFEIVLQGGHGELSQWCWRWHEAQGGVTQRMFRFFSRISTAQGYVKSAPYHNWFHATRQNAKNRAFLDIFTYQA